MTQQPQRPARASAAGQLEPGTAVDHFEVIRLLGRGGMGEVYLARDRQLGRKVALKMMRASQIGSPEAVEQLVVEARLTARFNHPNIVTIYAAGTYRRAPYVALEYLRGQNLRQRMAEERLGLTEAIRIGEAIAAALTEAHRNGILHRDLKPANVLIGADGRVRVVDFGLATLIRGPSSTSGAGLMGTPAYTAPELWLTGRSGEAADIWALGAVLFELFSGQHPFMEQIERTSSGAAPPQVNAWRDAICQPRSAPPIERYAEVPGQLSELIAACLAPDPALRPTAAAIVQGLQQLLHKQPRASGVTPYRGLLPFGEEHADLFFGRDEEIGTFCERVRVQPILCVVGPSGAGKSSFVKAGVIPRLREHGRLLVLSLRPGADPFRSLADRLLRVEQTVSDSTSGRSFNDTIGEEPARALSPSSSIAERRAPERGAAERGAAERAPSDAAAAEVSQIRLTEPEPADAAAPSHPSSPPSIRREQDARALAARLREAPRELGFRLHRLATTLGHRVLLMVDQLEELFALVDSAETRRRYMDAICTAADDAVDPVRVIFTVRDDYLGRLAVSPHARDALAQVTVIQALDAEALEQILMKPATALGYQFDDPALPAEMVAPLIGEPAGLPLLQFAAHALWEQRDRERCLLLRSAYQAMGGVEGALVKHADGVLDKLSAQQLPTARSLLMRLVSGQRTRRPTDRARALEGLGPGAKRVLDNLTASRLISLSKDSEGHVVLELAHESLITRWGTLTRWLDESREERVFINEIEPAATLWDRRGRRDDELWQGEALHEALRVFERLSDEPPHTVADFLEAARRRQEKLLRMRRLLGGALVGLSVAVAAVAVGVALFVSEKEHEADRQRVEAQAQRTVALEQRAEALREGARASFGEGRMMHARAKLRSALTSQDAAAARALWWQLSQQALRWRFGLGSVAYSASFAPDGSSIAVADHDGSIYLLDTQTSAPSILRGHADQVLIATFSPDGKTLLSGSWNGDLRLWDRASRKQLAGWRGHKSGVWGARFTRDGRQLITTSDAGEVIVWDRATHKQVRRFEEHRDGPVRGLDISPDGKTIATGGSDKLVYLWSLDSGESKQVLKGHEAEVRTVVFGPDGRWLASAGLDHTIRLWELERPSAPPKVLRGHEGAVISLSASPDGKLLASGSADNTVRLWDVATATALRVLGRHSGTVRGVSFHPQQPWLATAGYDSVARLYDVTTERTDKPHTAGHHQPTTAISFSPDDKLLASAGYDRTIRIWDVATGQVRQVLKGHGHAVEGVSFAPDGKHLASSGADHSVILWELSNGRELKRLPGHQTGVRALRFDEHKGRLASAGLGGTLRVWEPLSGRELLSDDGIGPVHKVRWQHDGDLLAVGGLDKNIYLYDLGGGEDRQILKGHERGVYGLAFSPDDTLLATSGLDKTLRLWTLASGEARIVTSFEDRVYDVDFSPDGAVVVAAVADRTARTWRVDGKPGLVLRGHTSEVNKVTFSGDGRFIATASDDSTLRLWDATSGHPAWRAPMLLASPPRLLTHLGWRPLDPPQRNTPAPPDPRSTQPSAIPNTRWREAVEARAAFATTHGDTLCLQTYGDTLELWSLSRDTKLKHHRGEQLSHLVASATGCAFISAGKAYRMGAQDNEPRALAASCSALTTHGDGLLLATGTELLRFDGQDAVQARGPIDVGASAIGAGQGWQMIGYRDGNLRLLRTEPGEQASTVVFEGTPSSPPTRIVAGPMNTVIVGYSGGMVAIWSLSGGERLAHAQLHGPVRHLLLEKEALYAASELGMHLRWDLSTLYRDYCTLVRDIWKTVPVVWQGGRPVLQAPPAEHRCRE